MNNAAQKPDIEFIVHHKGYCHSYGHVYFKPLKIYLFGKKIWGCKKLPTSKEKK